MIGRARSLHRPHCAFLFVAALLLTAPGGVHAGPGRDDPPPEDVREVLIGYFGPRDADHSTGHDVWLAINFAVDEANESGGYNGIPFRIVSAWSENPWGSGASGIARMVYDDGVWAMIGSIDGASTHLVEQVVAKAQLTLINPAATDKTVNLANVAWTFSCLPADDLQATAVARAIADRIGREPLTLVSATDHDSHLSMVEFRKALTLLGISPLHHIEFDPQTVDRAELSAWVAGTAPRAVLLLAGPVDSGRLLVPLRRVLDGIPVFGGASFGRRAFFEAAGRATEGVLFPSLCDSSYESSRFSRTFRSRSGRVADCTTGQAYDATRMLIETIQRTGLNRPRIRDAVADLSGWSGVAGVLKWNALGQNQRPARLATVQDGRIVPLESN
jgi:ABC-type branched-subunit amino acid transport system substrate-binding protein